MAIHENILLVLEKENLFFQIKGNGSMWIRLCRQFLYRKK
jgi:hypothetical protein